MVSQAQTQFLGCGQLRRVTLCSQESSPDPPADPPLPGYPFRPSVKETALWDGGGTPALPSS
jgi:hypothetical protein